MREMLQFYIDGKWVDPVTPNTLDVINPATEEVCGRISLGSAADVDLAVAAAKRAEAGFAATTREQRIELLESVLAEFMKRYEDIAEAVMDEMGDGEESGGHHEAEHDSARIAPDRSDNDQGDAFVKVPPLHGQGDDETAHEKKNHGVHVRGRGLRCGLDLEQGEEDERHERGHGDRDRLGDPPTATGSGSRRRGLETSHARPDRVRPDAGL